MNYKKEQWEKETIEEIEMELKRVQQFIDEYKEKGIVRTGYTNPYKTQINRATLDFNRVAVKLRKGFYNQ